MELNQQAADLKPFPGISSNCRNIDPCLLYVRHDYPHHFPAFGECRRVLSSLGTRNKDMYYKFDVVIVGAGGAGLMAAMQLPNSSVAVFSNVYPTRSHTGAAQGGVA